MINSFFACLLVFVYLFFFPCMHRGSFFFGMFVRVLFVYLFFVLSA